MKKRRSGRRQLVSVILVLILLLLTGCRQDKQNEGKNGDTVEADGDRTPGTVSIDNSENGREQTTGAGELQIMKNGSGVAVTELNTLTEESLATLKKAGITFVKVHIPYPFDAGGNMSSNYLNAKRAVKLIAKSGLEPVCQSFTPGGNAYNQTTGQVEWMSYLPAVFENYDDEYFYKLIRQGCEYIGKDLKEYGNCWIISNEPNLTTFTGPMTNEQIVRYIQTCADGIKTGNEKYKQAAYSIWGFIKEYLVDKRNNSEWFWLTDENGKPYENKPLVEPWKCPYHNGRMCMEIIKRI